MNDEAKAYIQYNQLSLKTNLMSGGPSYGSSSYEEPKAQTKDHEYYCSHCRTKLFTDKDVISHEPQKNQSSYLGMNYKAVGS